MAVSSVRSAALSEPIPELVPEWLATFRAGDRFSREAFFGSRVCYYPGSGLDGSAVKMFAKPGVCHCFVLVDYSVTREEIEASLDDPATSFRGYDAIVRVPVTRQELTPDGWSPVVPPPLEMRRMPIFPLAAPFALLTIFQRQPSFGPEHGAERFAVLFVAADGYAAYEALFGHGPDRTSPFALVLQDHGWGGNHPGASWGGGGHLECIANALGTRPQYLWCAANTRTWEGYERVPGVPGVQGGSGAHVRHLYVDVRQDQTEEARRGTDASMGGA